MLASFVVTANDTVKDFAKDVEPIDVPDFDQPPLESIGLFIDWVARHTSQTVLGASDDATLDPFAFYLREVWGATAPYVGCEFYLTNRLHHGLTKVFETPSWVNDMIYSLAVFSPSYHVTAADVLNALVFLHYAER